MKYIYLLIITALLFTGCSTNQPKKRVAFDLSKITLDSFESEVDVNKNGVITSTTNIAKKINYGKYSNMFYISKKESSGLILKGLKSAIEKNDLPFFALLNPGISNLEGFPINNMKDLSEYLKLDNAIELKGTGFGTVQRRYFMKEASFRNKETVIYILPLAQKNSVFPVWSTEEAKKYFREYKF